MSTILIVEDHAMSRQVLKSLLGYTGHRVLEAADGSVALALARAEAPDLIISDIAMPTMNGFEFVRLLRDEERLADTPVIFYTATYRLPDPAALRELCENCRVIAKPSEPLAILRIVNELLGMSPPASAPPPLPEFPSDVAPACRPTYESGLLLAALMDLNFHLIGQRDPMRMLSIFCRAGQEILRCGHTLLALMQDDGRTRYFLGDGKETPIYDLPVAALPEAEVLELVVARRKTYRRQAPAGGGVDGRPPFFESLLIIPFATHGRVYGWFCLADKLDCSPFQDEDEELAVGLAAQAALSYENIILIDELQRRAAELETVNKDLEAFSYSVSHDLRAPLRSIEGFTRAIAEDCRDKMDKTSRDYFDRVIAASQRMSQLIDALLTMSRMTRGEMSEKTVDLSAIAEVAAQELRSRQPERQVEFVIAHGVRTRGDNAMMGVVLENLLDNAWKFTGKHRRARIEFGVMERDGRDVYFVRDDGAGFTMDFADKLFMPFKRLHADSEFPGLGIGLATVQRIINRHGGKIWAEGAPEQGATFYFTV